MLRLIGFFVLVLLVLQVLRQLPFVGGLFQVPLLGFWLTAILVSAGASKLAAEALDRGKQRALMRTLGAVDTPHNMGKLGTLLLTQGRTRRALPYLEQAAEGEPDSAEWSYRLGSARLAERDLAGAVAAFERTLEINEEHAYGAALLRLAEARTRGGDPERALESLARFEHNHGPNPESAYRRGVALRKSGRAEEANEAFAAVGQLVGQLAKYQRKGAYAWVARAYVARMGG